MNIVWMSWKDKFHPEAGGAERMTDVILSGLVKRGHSVTLISPQYKNSLEKELAPGGYTIHRIGSRFSIYIKAWFLYFAQYKKSDLLIEEINAAPFFAPLVLPRKKTAVCVYHITREIWFYQMIFPINIICYIFEPLYYIFLSFLRVPFFTISESTKKDLVSYGVKKEKIFITPIPNELLPISSYSERRENDIRVLSLGSVRPMKRTLDIIKAFEYSFDTIPSLKLTLAGSTVGNYGKKVLKYIEQSRAKKSIEVIGSVTEEQKKELMVQSSMLAVTSVKEGWCIVATEAHSQGLPTVVYDVHGLRDSTRDRYTGLVVPAKPKELAQGIITLALNTELRQKMGKNALEDSRLYTSSNTVSTFITNLAQAFPHESI